MTARAHIGGHEYVGANLGSIVRREYGRRAGVRLSQPGTVELGTVVVWSAAADAWNVLGRVWTFEGELGDVEPAPRRREVRW